MLAERIGVYALVLGICASASITSGELPRAGSATGAHPPEIAQIPAAKSGQIDPSVGIDYWWALMEMRVIFLCAVLDCQGVNGDADATADGDPPVKALMQRQVISYRTSGVLPNLSAEEITQATKIVQELKSAMASAPAELGAELKRDYTDMLEGVRHDLGGSAN